MINFIGDLSKMDALVIEEMCRPAKRVLEFGVGGSTQIIATTCPDAEIISVDTSEVWVERTKQNFKGLGITKEVTYYNYEEAWKKLEGTFDVIFDDGDDNLRLDFARMSWKFLKPKGCMLFHDTRRYNDIGTVAQVLKDRVDDIESIDVNYNRSNITIVHKREAPMPLENWHNIEQKADGMWGGLLLPPLEIQ